jgi:dihydrofolate reductase
MSKVLYSATISMDGYLAGPGGDMSWLRPFLGPNPTVESLQEQIGALLVGANTFRGDDPNRGTDAEGAFSGTWSGPSFVVTHAAPQASLSGTTFVPDISAGLKAARAAVGEGYINVLGADIARQCIEMGEVDEILAIVAPVLLGGGTRFFPDGGKRGVALERLAVEVLPHATMLWYRVIDESSGRVA